MSEREATYIGDVNKHKHPSNDASFAGYSLSGASSPQVEASHRTLAVAGVFLIDTCREGVRFFAPFFRIPSLSYTPYEKSLIQVVILLACYGLAMTILALSIKAEIL